MHHPVGGAEAEPAQEGRPVVGRAERDHAPDAGRQLRLPGQGKSGHQPAHRVGDQIDGSIGRGTDQLGERPAERASVDFR